MFQKIGTMIFLSDFEATMEERKAMITRPALKEILHREFEEMMRVTWMKRGCSIGAFEALISKDESGKYRHSEMSNAFFVFGKGVVVGMELIKKKAKGVL